MEPYNAWSSWLTSSTEHNVFTVHPHCSMGQHFISFYCLTIFHCMNMSHVYIHHFMDIKESKWFVKLSGCLRIVLLWAFTSRLSWSVSSFLLGIDQGIADNSMFSFLRNCQTVFQSSCSNFLIPSNNDSFARNRILGWPLFFVIVFSFQHFAGTTAFKTPWGKYDLRRVILGCLFLICPFDLLLVSFFFFFFFFFFCFFCLS